MEKLLEVTGHECEFLMDASLELLGYAKAFDTVGNKVLADRMFDLSEKIQQSQDRIHKVVGVTISDEFKRSEESAASTVRTALAVIMEGK